VVLVAAASNKMWTIDDDCIDRETKGGRTERSLENKISSVAAVSL
jgi:hypothetical protein